jgi:transglutaminase-like putative cysteine protease
VKKYIISIMLILAASALFCAKLDPQFTARGNPTLYKQIHKLAESNLQNLPQAQRRNYAKVLKEHKDLIMAFLIAYEEDAKLAATTPATIISNYTEILQLLESEGLAYSPEFFLSYVAKQSVSDERITAYRKAMLEDGLSQALLISDPMQRFREVASWCVEKLQFQQTSGRDQAPLDITQNSLTGRCEEMQILFVAAARTVGIPSRPASTPWWAHTDNNHAWAEVYIDGAWHYTGDMDSAYWLDQTWFSGLVDKTVLILTEGSLPAQEDEVLIKGRYETVINSTRNYVGERTRNISLRCVDEVGNPMSSTRVSIMVYNWGALRPIITLKADAKGLLNFSSGSGDFYVSAVYGNKKALQLVRASEQQELELTIVLSEKELETIDTMLHYPANQKDWQTAPEAYREDVQARKALWRAQLDEWEARVIASDLQDSLDVALNTRGNFPAYQAFREKYAVVEDEFLQLLASSDPKFLWQADAALFEALYHFWLRQDAETVTELFAPTVHYEELPEARITPHGAELYPANFIQEGKNPRERMKNALQWLKRMYRIDEDKALSGLIRLDLAVLQKYLTSYQYRILAISVLKANGIPADFTRLPDHILVYLDEDWHYYNIKEDAFKQDKKQAKGRLCEIAINDEDGIPVPVTSQQLSLCQYVEGIFYTLNSSFEDLGRGRFRVQVPANDLYIQFGYRVSDSQTALQLYPLSEGTARLEIVAKSYPLSWQPASEEILALLEPDLLENEELILLGNFDQENSLRVLQKIIDAERDYVFLGFEEKGSSKIANYRTDPRWQIYVRTHEINALLSITLAKTKDGWQSYEGIWERLP